jgi:ketosteroid isomerase-like protein
MLTLEAIDRQETVFARAFAAADLALARPLYDPDVVYVSPTVRLFDWPRRIDGIDRTLEFIGLTIARCRDIEYRCVERALVTPTIAARPRVDDGEDAALVRIVFDWTADDARRLRSTYIVAYRYRDARIARQELYYDPSAPPEHVDG